MPAGEVLQMEFGEFFLNFVTVQIAVEALMG